MALNMRGRWMRVDKKDTVDDRLALDMAKFAAAVDLTKLCAGSWKWTWTSGSTSSISYCVVPGEGVRLMYSTNGRDYNYVAKVGTTSPNFGGTRYWWLCPACNQRVRILYGGDLFVCRQCGRLTYETAQKGGDMLITIDNRLYRIRSRLKGDWHFLHGPGPRPKYMKWDKYSRLVREYMNLRRMRNYALVGAVADIANLYGVGDQLSMTPDALKESVADEWKHHKAQPDRWSYVPPQPEPEDDTADLNRLTLGELAQYAKVPFAFAKEAQDEGLVRPDQGRTTRRKRYRERLKNWLRKLHKLREDGYTWDEIRDWSKRRWQPGHEAERKYPAQKVPPDLDVIGRLGQNMSKKQDIWAAPS